MFGWLKDKESPQDYKFSYNPSLSLPKEIDLVKNFPLVYNQLNTSSCVAHAVSMAYMVQLLQQKEKFFSPSRLFIYFNARQLDNPRIIRDEGTYLKSGIKSVVQFGACDESIWKFDTSKVNIKPSKLTNSKFDPYISGLTKQVEKYERVPKSREAIKNALFQGSAVVFGVYLYSKFQEQLEKNNYVFQLPERGDYVVGGHACFHPSTFINTQNGNITIDKINVGDFVLTHTGEYKKVTKVMKTLVNEDLIELKNTLGSNLLVTKNHPFLTKKYSDLYKLRDIKKHKTSFKNTIWKSIENLNTGDLLYYPFNTQEIIDNNSEIIYEEDFFKLIGIYMGDGNLAIKYSNKGNIESIKVRVSLGKDYPELIEEVTRLLKKYSKNSVGINDFKNHINLVCYDTELGKKILNLCGGPNNKKLNFNLLHAPINLQKQIIKGWYETDGCDDKNGFSISTSYENLLYDLTYLFKRCNLLYGVFCTKAHDAIIRGKVIHSKNSYSIRCSNVDIESLNQERTNHTSIIIDNYTIKKFKRKNINYFNYIGFVYNLEVEDNHSYTANGIAVHNCTITGFSDEKQAFKVRNSWSKYWGINGDFWMPYIIMESQFVDDLWKITFIEK